MFNFIDFAAVIVFLVTMFDDSTQLVTVPRSSSDPIAELCRALVVLKRERYHIREVFKLSSDGHAEKVYWYGRSQYIEALNAPHHINENVSCYTDYASGMRLKTPCKLDYDTHRVFDIVAPCNDEEDDVVVKRSILLPSENDGTMREVQIFDLDERNECGELPDPQTIEGLYRGYKDRDMYWMCADEKVIEPSDAVRYVRQRALAQYLTDSGHAGLPWKSRSNAPRIGWQARTNLALRSCTPLTLMGFIPHRRSSFRTRITTFRRCDLWDIRFNITIIPGTQIRKKWSRS